jgi:PIN domain nuclease of toxin-antitoxin system
VRLLLDTHVLLWWLKAPSLLKAPARSAITAPASQVFVSPASAWEMSIKQALGKLHCLDNLEEVLSVNGFQPLPISVRHALLAGGLPGHHQDPFDRMLVAQSQAEGLTLVTHDTFLRCYDIPLLVT